jgi:ArsR family transcriptional regulator, arsenate/arsenite/antimonite-responsive transcriptional repressor
MKDRRLESLETLFKALADRTRLRILALLAAGEVCVCDIHESLGLPQPTTSRHLAYLRRSGLVATRKQGLWVHYRLAAAGDPVITAVLDAVRHAMGHVPAADRDRRRLVLRQPGLDSMAAASCDASSRPCCGSELSGDESCIPQLSRAPRSGLPRPQRVNRKLTPPSSRGNA